jgi:hypothetical protein
MSNLSAGSKLPALAYLSDLAIKKPGTTVLEQFSNFAAIVVKYRF